MSGKAINEKLETYINGNVSDFKKWLKGAKKVDILTAIETAQGQYGISRHEMINKMRFLLEA